jgi:hypothetical protein
MKVENIESSPDLYENPPLPLAKGAVAGFHDLLCQNSGIGVG